MLLNRLNAPFYTDDATEHDLSDLITELKILKKANKKPHPNVVRLIGCCFLKGVLYLAF